MTSAVYLQQFDVAMRQFRAAHTIAIAVSGGGDSMALCLLLKHWAAHHQKELYAFTIDHGLRPESAAEALQVKAILEQQGIHHEILSWQGDKPATHLQERARAARYDLLIKACHDYNCDHLAVAHNREDQLETFWMRLGHGSGLDGLAGISSARNIDGINIIRPLLGFSRDDLRQICRDHGVTWIEDPSNQNQKYLRVKLRQFEELLTSEGMTPERMVQTMDKLRDASEALQTITKKLLCTSAKTYPEGYLTLDHQIWRQQPIDIKRRMLSAVIQHLSPEDYPVGFDGIENLAEKLNGADFQGATLGGCDIFLKQGEIIFAREEAVVAPPIPLKESILWDRRFRVTGVVTGMALDSYHIGALREAGLAELRKNKNLIDSALPFKIKRVLPALWQSQKLVAAPHLSYWAEGADPSLKALKITFQAKIV